MWFGDLHYQIPLAANRVIEAVSTQQSNPPVACDCWAVYESERLLVIPSRVMNCLRSVTKMSSIRNEGKRELSEG